MAITDNMKVLNNLSSDYMKQAIQNSNVLDSEDQRFQTVFQSALDLMNEVNLTQNRAETEEIRFALGYANNTHELQDAQEKANVALQYTVAVRDRFLEAYKDIMNIQI